MKEGETTKWTKTPDCREYEQSGFSVMLRQKKGTNMQKTITFERCRECPYDKPAERKPEETIERPYKEDPESYRLLTECPVYKGTLIGNWYCSRACPLHVSMDDEKVICRVK